MHISNIKYNLHQDSKGYAGVTYAANDNHKVLINGKKTNHGEAHFGLALTSAIGFFWVYPDL